MLTVAFSFRSIGGHFFKVYYANGITEESMKKSLLAFALPALLAMSAPSWGLSCSTAATCTAGGTQLATLMSQPTIANIGSTKAPIGTVSSWAFSGDAANPFSSHGGLTFIYQVSITGDDLSTITFGNNFDSSALATNGGSGTTPLVEMNNQTGGVTFGFFRLASFTSDFLVVYTDQTTYSTQLATLNDTGTSNAADLGPMAGVPEPTSMALFGSGLFGLAGVMRRRRQRS